MHAQALELIGADTGEYLLARGGKICVDRVLESVRMVRRAVATVSNRIAPSRATATPE
jgi:hypothetical protein